MKESDKLKIAVVFGGRSTEHEVSRKSAYSILNNMDLNKYEPIIIGITKDGKWVHYTGDYQGILNDSWMQEANGNNTLEGVSKLLEADCIFPALHGPNGEDGTVQGLFELINKPYVGCGVLSSAISMDKAYTKIICDKEGIPQCRYTVFKRKDILNNIDSCVAAVESDLGYPCFVKPSNAGSSIGVSKASDRDELIEGLNKAQKYDIRIVVEEMVYGKEIECAVLGNDSPMAAVPGEAVASNDFYDYEAKYIKKESKTIIPADIPDEAIKQVQEYAKRIFACMDCRGLSRIDFFVENGTNKVIFNELNTLPGFTDISMYSKMCKASGIEFGELIDRLIQLAVENFNESKRIFDAKEK